MPDVRGKPKMRLFSEDVWGGGDTKPKNKASYLGKVKDDSGPTKPVNKASFLSSASAKTPKITQANRPLPTGMAKALGRGGRGFDPAKRAAGSDWKTSVTPAKASKPAKDDNYNRREELGGFYLNATSGMFSKKAGGNKKKP